MLFVTNVCGIPQEPNVSRLSLLGNTRAISASGNGGPYPFLLVHPPRYLIASLWIQIEQTQLTKKCPPSFANCRSIAACFRCRPGCLRLANLRTSLSLRDDGARLILPHSVRGARGSRDGRGALRAIINAEETNRAGVHRSPNNFVRAAISSTVFCRACFSATSDHTLASDRSFA